MTDRRLPGAAILAGGGDNHNQKERPLVVAACSQAIAFLFGMSLDHEQERLMDSSNITNQDIEREAKSPQVPYGTMNNRQTNNHGDSVATAAAQPSANALSSTRAQHSQEYPETVMNLSLFDPPRWGWTAVGGVADVLTPHERSRRRSTCLSYKKEYQQRRRRSSAVSRGSSATSQRQNSSSRIVTATTIATVQEHTQQPSPQVQQPQPEIAGVSKEESFQEKPVDVDNVEMLEQAEFSVPNPLSGLTEMKDSSLAETKPQQSITDTAKHTLPQFDAPPSSTNDANKPVDNSRTQPATATPATATEQERTSVKKKSVLPTTSVNAAVQKDRAVDESMPPPPPTNLSNTHAWSSSATSMRPPKEQPQHGRSPSLPPIPEGDMGIKLVGVPSKLLGVTIRQATTTTTEAASYAAAAANERSGTGKNQRKTGSKGSKYDCVVHSLGDVSNGDPANATEVKVLDMYTYHRGREGMEPRDKDCGELLCFPEVTDTNHDLDAPKLKVSIKIQFPLDDEDCDDAETASYQDVIDWDLSDPSTPSPLAFATSIASEYGLGFGATLDLAASIEQQIEVHLESQCQYGDPITLKDPSGILEKNRQPGPMIQTYRYGSVGETRKEGFSRPIKLRAPSRVRSVASSSTGGKPYEKSAGMASDTDSVVSRGTASHQRRWSSMESVGTASDRDDDASDRETVEDMYVIEMKKRAREASALEISIKCENGVVGELQLIRNGICHICHKRAEVTYLFACGQKHHSYCKFHCSTRLGIEKDFVCSFCPICTLNCECAKCGRKAVLVSTIFKAKCLEQNVAPAEAEFPEVFGLCSNVKNSGTVREEAAAAAQAIYQRKIEKIDEQKIQKPSSDCGEKPNAVYARTTQKKDELMVPKPPLNHFPTEMMNNEVFEVAETNDYYTVFTPEGPRLTNELPDDWTKQSDPARSATSVAEKGSDVVEDGSVDYCHYCMKPGDIICCDFCPRAFHSSCMKNNSDFNELTPSDEKWECTICKKENLGLPDEFVDGKGSMDQICSSFINAGAVQKDVNGFVVLSMIHELVLKLMNYDFGYMFSKPVDLSAVPGYTLVVKQPMDLGTICSNLINGDYANALNDECSMDDVLAMALKDIELVWHNCLTYNFEGSAVCRMAEVLRKRADRIRMRSFNERLSRQVKGELEEFIRDREHFRVALQSAKHLEESKAEIQSWKPRSVHRIEVCKIGQNNAKAIAVLDPVAGRVVLTYSSAKNAARAVHILLTQGHRCEWNAKLGLNMKLIAQKSARDPSMLVFGYRWVFLDDLRSNRVAFLEPSSQSVEMRDKECTYLFNSIEEALSHSGLANINHSQLCEFLKALPCGAWGEFSEMEWRRPQIPECREPRYLVDEEENDAVKVKTRPLSSQEKYDSWEKCAIVKRDLISGRNLVGFQNATAAYKDWIQTTLASPTFPASESRSIEKFEKHYLDGNRNVDGIIWRNNHRNNDATTSRLHIVPVSVSGSVQKHFIADDTDDSENIQRKASTKRKRREETNGDAQTGVDHEDPVFGNDIQNKKPK